MVILLTIFIGIIILKWSQTKSEKTVDHHTIEQNRENTSPIQKIVPMSVIPRKTSAEIAGEKGEIRVGGFLRSFQNGEVISNLILKGPNGQWTQIDHVYITLDKIYVIETKNYNAAILIDPEATNWRVRYGRKFKNIYNPIMQNIGHIRAIIDFVDPEYIESAVVFVHPNCKLVGSVPGVYTLEEFKNKMSQDNETQRAKILNVAKIYTQLMEANQAQDRAAVQEQKEYAKSVALLNKGH